MSSLDQPRETATIATWRSETFKALGKTNECKKMRNEQIHGMKDTLFRDLSKTPPILFTRRETTIRFYLQVLVPAVKLATTIQTSASKYAFTFQKSLSIQFKPLTPSWFKIHKIVDIKTGKSLKPDSAIVPDEQRSFGDFVINSEPGLCRVNKDGGFTPDNALDGAQQNLRLEWGHLSQNLEFKGVRSAGDSIVVMLRRGGFIG